MRKVLMSIACVALFALAPGGYAYGAPGGGAAGAAEESRTPLASLIGLELHDGFAGSGETDPSLPGSAAPVENDRWIFRFTPYFWAADLDGTLGVNNVDTSVDASFSDIWDNLDIALQGHFEAERGRWLAFLDGTYMKLEPEGTGPGGVARAELEQQTYIVELGGGYRVWEAHYGEARSDGARDHAVLDVLGGGRYMRVETDLDLRVGGVVAASGDDTEWWVDPFAGARIRWSPLSLLEFTLRGDVGGFGIASDFAWNVTGGVSVQLLDWLAVLAGYRILDVDYSDGGFKFDARMKGPWAGLTLLF